MMKLNKSKIIILVLLLLIIANSHKFFKIKKEETQVAYSPIEEETQVSYSPIEENTLEVKLEDDEIEKIESEITDWNLILVNKNNTVPDNYEFKREKIEEKFEIDSRVKNDLEKMLADARKAGLKPIICSAYRTNDYQETLYNKKVSDYLSYGYSKERAKKEASYWVTIPGTSEHEIGLAVDIVSEEYQKLDKKQENTKIQKWLMEHCYEYGFILRYPTEKKQLTKINYEPWHYRYVGEKDAIIIKEKGLCLEEYIDYLQGIKNLIK